MKGRISKWLPCEPGDARPWTLSPIVSLLRSRSAWDPQHPDLPRPAWSSARARLGGPRADLPSGLVAVVVSSLPVLVDEDPDGSQRPDQGHGGKKHLGEDGTPPPPPDLIPRPGPPLRRPPLLMGVGPPAPPVFPPGAAPPQA